MTSMTLKMEPFEYGETHIPAADVTVHITPDGRRDTTGGLFDGELLGFEAPLDGAYIGIDELGAAGGPRMVLGWHPVYLSRPDARRIRDHRKIDEIVVQA